MATATVFDPRLLESAAFKLPADYVTLPESYHPKPERFVGLLSCQSEYRPSLLHHVLIIFPSGPTFTIPCLCHYAHRKEA